MGLIRGIAETLRRRSNMNDTVRELHKLRDYELRDIGIHRSQIEGVARGIIDFHRTVRDDKILSSPEDTLRAKR